MIICRCCMKLRTLTANAIAGKTVLLRTDFNVPFNKDEKSGKQKIADDRRLLLAKPTIDFLIKHKSKIVILSHLGRPQGKVVPELSMEPIANHLENLIQTKVRFVNDIVGEKAQTAVKNLKGGEILVLDNVRFHPGEKTNDEQFSKELSGLAEVYINEAFSAAHREHASVVGVAARLQSFAGFAFVQELESLQTMMINPRRPFVMVVGGAKISDKVAAVSHLTKIADVVLVGGGVANNFLKAEGINIANSYLQDSPADAKQEGSNFVEIAENLLHQTRQERMLKNGYIPLPKIIYPLDVIAAKSMEARTFRVVPFFSQRHTTADTLHTSETNDDDMFLDIGPSSIRLFRELVLEAGTVYWNGPLGVFEKDTFANGTKEVAQAIAKSAATTIVGGGDTLAAIAKFGLEGRFDHVSAAGGSALAFLSGKVLPGVACLLKE